MRTAPSTRAQVITRRTYNRPVNDNGTQFETWEQTVGPSYGPSAMAVGKSIWPTTKYV